MSSYIARTLPLLYLLLRTRAHQLSSRCTMLQSLAAILTNLCLCRQQTAPPLAIPEAGDVASLSDGYCACAMEAAAAKSECQTLLQQEYGYAEVLSKTEETNQQEQCRVRGNLCRRKWLCAFILFAQQLPSPAVTTSSVATQSEPLPTSFHLDGLLNSRYLQLHCIPLTLQHSLILSSSPPPNEGLRTQRSEGCEEVDGVAILSAQPPLEERGMVWPCNSLSELTQPLCLPPPLVPSPPLTLSRSPTPARHTSHDSRGLPLTRDQLDPTPTHSTPSPFFRSVSCDGQKISYSLHSPSPIKYQYLYNCAMHYHI